jgi:hypothetical protein
MGLNVLVTTTTDATFNGPLLYTWLMWFLYSVGTMMNPSDKSSPMSGVNVSFAIGCMTPNRNAPISILNGLVSCSYLYDIPGFEKDGRIHKMKFVLSYPNVRRLLFLHALSQTGNYDAIIYADLDAFFVRNPLPELINYQKEGASVAFSRAAFTTNLPCNGFLSLYDRTLTSEYIKYGYYSQNQIGETWFKSALELLQKDEKKLFSHIKNTYEDATNHTSIASYTIPKLKSDTVSILRKIKISRVEKSAASPKVVVRSAKPAQPPPQRYSPTQLDSREYISQPKEVWKIRFLDGWNYYRGLCADIPSYATVVHCQSTYFDSNKKSSDLEKYSLLLPFTDGHNRILEKNFSNIFIQDLKDRVVKISEYYMRDTNTLSLDDKTNYKIKINTFQFRPDLNGKQLKTVIESLPGWKLISSRFNISSSTHG